MTTVPAVLSEVGKSGILVTWSGLAASGDDGAPVELPDHPDKTVQIDGTNTGSPTCVLEGSIDGTTYVALTDGQGNAISKTLSAASIEAVAENPRYIRPRLSAGAGGAAVAVRLLCRGRNR